MSEQEVGGRTRERLERWARAAKWPQGGMDYPGAMALIAAAFSAEARVQRLEEALRKSREFARDLVDNWDCDVDAHRYGTRCRVCDAERERDRLDAVKDEAGVTAAEYRAVCEESERQIKRLYELTLAAPDKEQA